MTRMCLPFALKLNFDQMKAPQISPRAREGQAGGGGGGGCAIILNVSENTASPR